MTYSYADQLDLTVNPTSLAAGGARAFRSVAGLLPQDKTLPMIEIGPGHAAFLRVLRDNGYVGAEAIEADRVLTERALSAGLPVTHCPAEDTVAYLRERPGQFHLIYCAHVLEHVPIDGQIEFLIAIRDALSESGVFICEVPNASSPIATHNRYVDWTHKCLFTASSLQFVLSAAGFSNISVTKALPDPITPRSAVADPLVKLAQGSLVALSSAIHRLHMLAHLGAPGLGTPISNAIFACARKAA